jgi:hypothetical protein
LSVADAIDGHYFEEGEDGPKGGFGKDVGPRQEDRRLGGEAKHGERLHEGLLMAGGYNIGSVGGQVFKPMYIEPVVMATGTILYQRTEQIVKPVVVLY